MNGPPSPAARVALGAVAAYRRWLAPWFGGRCRFEPSCSVYAEQAIRAHGALKGSWLALRRLLRCGPWSTPRADPVPPGRHDAARRSIRR